jgi:hypothetical protein
MAADVTVAPTLGHALLMTQGGVGTTPGYDAIDLRRMMQAASSNQEGVFDSTGWKVSENSGGANMTVQVAANVGLARVTGESVTHQGPYIVAPHSAVITLDVSAAHSTNPRVDMVILQVRDNTHDALGANDARVRILAGTATSGATLDNLNGQASLPSNSLRLADVLVPAADTTISNAQIRDRRLWALGVYYRFVRTAGSHTTASTSFAIIDSTTMQPRIECSGASVRMWLRGKVANSSAGEATIFRPYLDGAAAETSSTDMFVAYLGPTANEDPSYLSIAWDVVPAAGSHLFAWGWRTTGGLSTLAATAGQPLQMIVEEIARPSATNG